MVHLNISGWFTLSHRLKGKIAVEVIRKIASVNKAFNQVVLLVHCGIFHFHKLLALLLALMKIRAYGSEALR